MSIATFNILEHLDRLNIIKETYTEYQCSCPVCGESGFKINKSSGKYYPFKCNCNLKDIREAIRPWSEVRSQKIEGRRGGLKMERVIERLSSGEVVRLENSLKTIQRVVKKGTEEPVELAVLSSVPKIELDNITSSIPNWLQKQGIPENATETKYWYSKTQFVSRFEWKDDKNPKGRDKTFRQGHILPSGQTKWNKGNERWSAYRISEAYEHCENKWVIGVEGEKCVEAARGERVVSITWQGSNWKPSEIEKDLAFLQEAGGAGLAYIPDLDSAGTNKAKMVELAGLKLDFPVVIVPVTNFDKNMPAKGDIADYLASNKDSLDSEEFISKLESAIHEALAEKEYEDLTFSGDSQQKPRRDSGKRKIPKPDLVAEKIAERYKDKWCYCDELKSWLGYSLEKEGIWTLVSKDYMAAEIHQILKAENIRGYGTNSYIDNIIGGLKRELFTKKWNQCPSKEWLPFKNGVLELATGKLHAHSPGFRFLWQLPRDYVMFSSNWSAIDRWLTEATRGKEEDKELLICFAAAILRGRSDLQNFLHLIGGGGSGKSTFTTLLTDLIGEENTATVDLEDLSDKHAQGAFKWD